MTERVLAHIERIINIEPIEGADKIEKATVLGWQVVVRKSEFNIGDLACYIEIDSVVPAIPYFEFMQPRKYRVKTIKLRGQISQGLLIPLTDLVQINKILDIKDTWFFEGEDLTELINIKKYESPSDRESNWQPLPKKKYPWIIRYFTRYNWFRKLFKMRSKSFPSWISKTDEERLQNMPWILLKDRSSDWYVTEKLDGQSATYWYIHKLFPEFGICSRSVRKSELDGNNWSKVAKQFNIKNKLKNINGDYAIQGEIIGPKIQGGKYHNVTEKNVEFPLDFYVFNVYDIKNKKYLDYNRMLGFCREIGLKTVPLLLYEFQLKDTVEQMLWLAEGTSIIAKTEREGIVCRKIDQSKSFKVISNKYLFGDKE